MRSSLLAAVTALLVALPLTSSAVADPGKADPELPPTASDTAREHAEEVLDQAQALFDSTPAQARRRVAVGDADATLVLNQLMLARSDLTPADRKRANALLARPTDGAADPEGDGYTVPEEEPVCGDTVCVHYVATTDDAPADAGGTGVPPSVQAALATAESVNDTYTRAGYRRPDPDGALGGDSNKVDIYLADVGNDGLYGYCTSDQPDKTDNTWNYWAYCVIDNDFRVGQFPTNTPRENQRVTLAHEYYHAVQFAYDAAEDPWFLEATATWAEDELYDGVNDNRQYLRYGQLKKTRLPLDEFENGRFNYYGNWIFFRYLTERWGGERGTLPRIMMRMWRAVSGREGARDLYSTQAIERALRGRHSSFTKVYGQFAAANRHPGRTYEEGARYPVARPSRRATLGRRHRRTGMRRTSLDHQTNQTMRFRPGRGTRSRRWKLRVDVDMPARRTAPVARLVIQRKGGALRHRVVRLDRNGVGRVTVPFSSRGVRHVELVLVNASRRTDCWASAGPTFYACSGNPRDDFRGIRFSARILRR